VLLFLNRFFVFANRQKERLQEYEKWSWAEAESANVGALESDLWPEICRRADGYDVLLSFLCCVIYILFRFHR